MNKGSVAVIAVHGVGHHEAGETSASIAKQLQCADPTTYGSFACTPTHIAVSTADLAVPASSRATVAAQSSKLPRTVAAAARGASPDAHGANATDIDFTAITLAGGGDYTDNYVTTRLRCSRPDQTTVDVFEMFWSDLSHGGTQGGLTAVRQMIQLFLHVASLGRSALGSLLASRGNRTRIPVLHFVYGASAWGYWLLAVPIALGNILMLCLGVAFLALLVPNTDAGRIGTAAVIGVTAACGLGFLVQKRMRRPDAPPWVQRLALPAIWLSGIGLVALGSWRESRQFFQSPDAAFMLAVPLTLLAGSVFVRRYEISRPGALKAWAVILTGAVLWAFAEIGVMEAKGITLTPLNWFVFFVEGHFAWLVLAWGALALVNLTLLVAGVYAKYRHPYDDVRRSIDTGLIAAAVPAPLLLVVVLTLWSGYAALLREHAPGLMATVVPTAWGDASTTLSDRLKTLIDLSASPAAVPFLVCMVVAFACAIVAFLPSVIAELLPPPAPTQGTRALGLWRWLNQGFRLLRAAKWIAVAAFFLLLPAGALLRYRPIFPWTSQDLGLVVGGSALAYLSLTRLMGGVSLGKLSRAFASLRVVIDTAIDVDNWLRERPVGETPRLRIMARYVSLLRHLKSEGYERIVVVSHSQGTVITLDLLRYLKARNAGFLAQLAPIDLLTFGSPLRQLYAARFPGIYGWARNANLSDAGVASWGNGYGSGDYVGRNLWKGNLQTLLQSTPPHKKGCYEFCTGALGHIHYFDKHSPGVATAILAAL
jgi:hypothetical protein